MKLKILSLSILTIAFAGNSCKSAETAETYRVEYPRWIGDTAYQLQVDGVTPLGKNRQASEDKACAAAMRGVDRAFSEQIVGVSITTSCPPDPGAFPYCNWEYRLRPDVFTFKAKEISRKAKPDGKYIGCRVIAEYADPDLRRKVDEYVKKIFSE